MSDADLRELIDRQKIAEVLADYVRGADRIDVELLRSVFHPEATADYGEMYRGTGYGFADFIGSVHPGMDTHHHQLGSIAIRLDGDRAASETYVTVHLRFTRPDGTSGLTTSHGRYSMSGSGGTGAGASPVGATCTTSTRPGTAPPGSSTWLGRGTAPTRSTTYSTRIDALSSKVPGR